MKKKNLLLSAALISALMLSSCGSKTGTTTTNSNETTTITNETTTITNETPTNSNPETPSNTSTNPEEPNNPDLVASTSLSSSFNNIFYKTLENEVDKNNNVLVSPFSIVMDFGMLENGAKGSTKEQMETYLNGGMSVEDLNEYMKTLKDKMMNSKELEWNVANSIWFNESQISDVSNDVKEIVKKYYDSEINKRPYNNDTLEEINNWVKKNTNDMIPVILDKLNPSDVMHLINAVAFEGDWYVKFDEHDTTKNAPFKNLDGSTTNVDMLHSMNTGYFSSNDYIGFTKAFADQNYSFFAMKSQKGLSPLEMMKKMKDDNEDISTIMTKYGIDGMANIGLPKFELDYDTVLNKTLADLGVTNAFSPSADFSKLADSKDPLYISKVIHKTHFELSETGVKAAAATSIAMTKGAMIKPKLDVEINMDEPFIYGIYDNKNGLPIFIGCINNFK